MNRTLLTGPALALAAAAAWAQDSPFPDGTHLYGYGAAGMMGGAVYELTPATAPSVKWNDAGYDLRSWGMLYGGWYDAGKLHGIGTEYMMGFLMGCYSTVYDWETGEGSSNTDLGTSGSTFLYGALNPTDQTVYGFGLKAKSSTRVFLKAPAGNLGAAEVVRELPDTEICYGVCWNPDSQVIAAMRGDGTLVNVAADGTQTPVKDTGVETAWKISSDGRSEPPSGITWSPTEKVYYWNPALKEGGSALYTIDPASGEIYRYEDFAGENYNFLVAVCDRNNAAVPAAPVIRMVDFPFGSTSGKITIELPSTTETGEPLDADMTWTATLNGSTHATGSGHSGQTAEVEYDLETGNYLVGFTVSLDGNVSEETSRQLFVGIDTPAAPVLTSAAPSHYSWAPVTTGAHGGYIDTEGLTYSVYINGELFTTTSETEWTDESMRPESADEPVYYSEVYVTATAGELTSEPSNTIGYVGGQVAPLPLAYAPTEYESHLFTVTNSPDEGKGWAYNAAEGWFDSGFGLNTALDEWLWLPRIDFNGEEGRKNLYSFAVDAKRRGTAYEEEYIEVGLYTEADPTSEKLADILAKTQVQGDWSTLIAEFEAPLATGFIGIHAVSEAHQFGVLARNFNVSAMAVSNNGPAQVTGISATPGAEGALTADVTFTLPTLTVGGAEIPAGTEITVEANCQSAVTHTGTPGQTLTATVSTAQGNNTVTLTPSIGEYDGLPATVNVYTGVHVPDVATGLAATVSDDMKSVTLTWDAPEDGFEGGYIDPAGLTYNVFIRTETTLGEIWEKLAEGLSDRSFTYETQVAAQDVYKFGITPVNVAGQCPETADIMAVLGTPYHLPMYETFETSDLYAYTPWVVYVPDSDYNTRWGVLPLSVLPFGIDPDEGDNVLCGMGLADGCKGRAGFPVFTTAGETSVTLQTRLWTGTGSTPDLRILGAANGMETPVEVGRASVTDGWATQSFELPDALLGKSWVKLYLEASFPEGSSQWVVMDDYRISPYSGVTAVAAGEIRIEGGRVLTVTTAVPMEIRVYDMQGRGIVVATATAGQNIYPLAPGIYTVRAGERTVKLAIR